MLLMGGGHEPIVDLLEVWCRVGLSSSAMTLREALDAAMQRAEQLALERALEQLQMKQAQRLRGTAVAWMGLVVLG